LSAHIFNGLFLDVGTIGQKARFRTLEVLTSILSQGRRKSLPATASTAHVGGIEGKLDVFRIKLISRGCTKSNMSAPMRPSSRRCVHSESPRCHQLSRKTPVEVGVTGHQKKAAKWRAERLWLKQSAAAVATSREAAGGICFVRAKNGFNYVSWGTHCGRRTGSLRRAIASSYSTNL
jgi:hypothetical protein